MFGWEYPPYNSGGLGVACQGLAEALAKKNIELVFVLPKKLPLEEKHFRFRYANVPDTLFTAYQRLSKEEIFMDSSLFAQVMEYARQAAKIARTENADLIHAHDWLTYPAGLAVQEKKDIPLVAHIHATEFDRGAGSINKDIYDIESLGMNKANKVISVSEFTRQLVGEKYKVDTDKISVVHNGVNIQNSERSDDLNSGLMALKKAGKKIVLFAGRLTIQKGPDYFLKAAAKVLHYNKDVVFVIAGSGDMEGQLMNEAASIGIASNVLFTGFLRDKELSDAFALSDVFVLSSISEPFGITPLESLALGTPVIVSKQSGVSEVLSHAFKVDYWDVDEMAEAILCVINYPNLQRVMSLNGQKQAVSCTWDKAADKCINVYKSLL